MGNEDYGVKPVHGHGTCTKDETAPHMVRIISNIVDQWYTDPNGFETRGPMNNFSSDGCAMFVLAGTTLEHIVLSQALAANTILAALFVLLGVLTLFDLSVGDHGMVFVCDAKHAFKRFRTRLKSLSKSMRVNEQVLSLVGIRDLLVHGGGIGVQKLNRMFDPSDEQNVPFMVECFETMGQFEDFNYDDYSFPAHAPNENARRELIYEFKILCAICQCLFYYLSNGKGSIEEHLINLSKLSHLLFVVFRKSAGNFMAPQNYHNIQSVIKGMYKSVATCKYYGINCYFLFQDNDDRLENLFRDLRALGGGGRNFDMLQLEERIKAAMIIQEIYNLYPNLKRASRRLNGSMDHWNPLSWLGATFPGTMDSGVDLKECWEEGARQAAEVLTRDGVFQATDIDWNTINLEVPKPTMYKPHGIFVEVAGRT